MIQELQGRIFVTGGAGFLARALYLRAESENWPAQFVAFSRDDTKHVNLQRRFPMVECIRGDVAADPDHLTAAMMGSQTVLHLAADKYVDRAELNAWATIRTNVIGSMNVIRAAIAARAETTIVVSTDKAAGPVNIYGASKFAMERLVQDLARLTLPAGLDPRFIGVRYGNVIGSTGSVIPLFQQQIAATGRVQVTDPEMTRFWMTHNQAIDCILDAYRDAETGTITIPGQRTIRAMRLLDLAHLIAGDMKAVDIVGIRPGEKRHEDMVTAAEGRRIDATGAPRYLRLLPPNRSAVISATQAHPGFTSEHVPHLTPTEMADAIKQAATI